MWKKILCRPAIFFHVSKYVSNKSGTILSKTGQTLPGFSLLLFLSRHKNQWIKGDRLPFFSISILSFAYFAALF
jgi:hypothetical protein